MNSIESTKTAMVVWFGSIGLTLLGLGLTSVGRAVRMAERARSLDADRLATRAEFRVWPPRTQPMFYRAVGITLALGGCLLLLAAYVSLVAM